MLCSKVSLVNVGITNPIIQAAWASGAQMAALNFQANDRAMWLNRGKFVQNGGCGYVKKPVYLLDSSEPRPSNAYTLRVFLNFPMELQNTHAC